MEFSKTNLFVRKEHAPPKWLFVFKYAFIFMVGLHFTVSAFSQNNSTPGGNKEITGLVTDSVGGLLQGVSVSVKGDSRIGTSTDVNGKFILSVPDNAILVFGMVGFTSREIPLEGRSVFNVTLLHGEGKLDDIVVVAYGTQKKSSVVSSITTISPKELKGPTSNLTTMLAGRLAGVISYQRSGEPGADNAEFFIRGVTTFGYAKSPLILLDGIELTANDLSRIHPDDIASFSIMKDATATALYGARGANGVILVTSKEGREGKAQVSVRLETSLSQPTQKVGLADPYTYMVLHNEAVRTRDPLGILPYSPEKVENTLNGDNPYIYPATDWYKALMNDNTNNHRLNFSISGGGKAARYYLSGAVDQDNGNLKVDKRNNFNSNIGLKKYQIRSNININLTKTTEAVIRVYGTFDDYRGPLDGGTSMYNKIMLTNPVLFPATFPNVGDEANTNHILFGNYGRGNYLNPYAELVKGYKESSASMMLAQFELKEDLDYFIKGLKVRILGNTTRYSYFELMRNYNPYYYFVNFYDEKSNDYKLKALNSDNGTEYLNYREGEKKISSSFYSEAAVQYDRTFNDHGVSGLLVATMRQSLTGNSGDLQKSLPYRNLGVSGRFTYSYDSRFFGEVNFGYNGSERFAAKERFGFFPSVGAGWFISNEKFWNPLKNTVSKLKLKATYGYVGNDAIGSEDDRFFYLSNVNLNDLDYRYSWGVSGGTNRNGVSISRYANDLITWETAQKTNLGIELGLFGKIEINAEVFKEYRKNILIDRISLATLGLQAQTKANVGEASSKGFDVSLNANHSFNKNFWMASRVNFTYAKGIFEKYEEPDYSKTPWKSKIGQPINQQWGYIAERLFVDDLEVANSPNQQLGSIVRGGDIKYHDINGDDKITPLDMVPLGYPTTPEITYGFGLSTGFKGFDFSFFFQGSARSSFWVNPKLTSPFTNSDHEDYAGYTTNNALLSAYANSHWSEANRDVYALWPRLSDKYEWNNLETNSWFLRNGAFLRLKSLEFGYTPSKLWSNRLKLDNMRFYANGTNLFYLSKFDLWDPEMGGNGLGYPIQRVFNLGIQISF